MHFPIPSSLLWFALIAPVLPAAEEVRPLHPEGMVELNDNGAWSWFMDERAIVDNGHLIVGSARANGDFGDRGRPGWGNVELAVLDLDSGEVDRIVLHEGLEQDDHNGPGLAVMPDGRYLAPYSKHSTERRLYWRLSKEPGNPYDWDETKSLETPGTEGKQFGGDNVTYTNPFWLSEEPGRVYLFYRGYSHDPNYLVSSNGGEDWEVGGHWLRGRDGYAPYLKFTSNGRDAIHFVATEDHPRNFDNSLYHGFLRGGRLHHSDGRVVAPLHEGLDVETNTWDFTRVFEGGPDRVAWMSDIELDPEGSPVILFTVQRGGEGLPRKQGGDDHRFHLARWNGSEWEQHEVAHAGKRLYSGEDDYTGLGAIDPLDPNHLVISTDADPVTGEPLVSKSDGKRHHELFEGRSDDRGKTWKWTALTRDSEDDNLRPLIPRWDDPDRLAVVWMRGSYTANRGSWTTRVMAAVLERDDDSGGGE